MTITVTKDQLRALKPCEISNRLRLFGSRTSLNAEQAFAAGASISDLLWVASRLGHKDLCAKFALACAKRVEHRDKSGKAAACNDATVAYISNPSPTKLEAMRRARSAAAAAADYAARSADYADYAARSAAYAAADYAAEVAAQQALFIEIFR